MDKRVMMKLEGVHDKMVDWIDEYTKKSMAEVDAKELEMVCNAVHYIAETIKCGEEACYYKKVTEAMEDKSDDYLMHSDQTKPYVNQMPYVDSYLYGNEDRRMGRSMSNSRMPYMNQNPRMNRRPRQQWDEYEYDDFDDFDERPTHKPMSAQPTGTAKTTM